LLTQTTEFQFGAYYQSNKELSPVISVKMPNFLISLSYNIQTAGLKRFALWDNTFETNMAVNINCHKRNNESEKMRCHF
jgi:hypothetical protein